MEPQYMAVPRDDFWRLQSDVKNFHSVQLDHADRLLRLEKRQEEDARMKSVWGTSSPFPNVLSSTSQQGSIHTPPAGDGPSFAEGQRQNLLGGLHLDQEDEPKRGASRANSVRFDESAISGHWGQSSRTSNDFLPMRGGSDLGSHPMVERSSSHKSDGRHSSAGQSIHSIHSTRTNSLGIDTSFPLQNDANTPLEVAGPSPGLFFLGPVPSIVRCWIDETFSNDTLLYAVVCTGSYRSCIDIRALETMGLQDRIITEEKGDARIRIPIYLSEALLPRSAPRSTTAAPQVPTITVDFSIIKQNLLPDNKAVQIILGSDILKTCSADILLSQNCISLTTDDQSKVSVPLVRPEDESSYRFLCTRNMTEEQSNPVSESQTRSLPPSDQFASFGGDFTSTNMKEPSSAVDSGANGLASPSDFPLPTSSNQLKYQRSGSDLPAIGHERKMSMGGNAGAPSDSSLSTRNEAQGKGKEIRSERERQLQETSTPTEGYIATSQTNDIWGSWRRQTGQERDSISNSPTTSSGYQRPGRGRGTKVLRPSKASTSSSFRSVSSPQNGWANVSSVPNDSTARATSSTNKELKKSTPTDPQLGSESSQALNSPSKTSQPGKSNPVGGASAFGWLSGTTQK